jgi:hypothetical protein
MVATFLVCGVGEPLSTPAALRIRPGGRRGLEDEAERAVLEHRDLDRDDVAALRLGRRVVLLAELHDVDAVLTEGGADGRRGRRDAGLDLELDDAGELLLGRHVWFPGGEAGARA